MLRYNHKYKDSSLWNKLVNQLSSEELVPKFAEQLFKDEELLNSGGLVSDCALNAPRVNGSRDRKTKFGHALSLKMFPVSNVKDPIVERKYSYIKYCQLVSKLRKQFKKQMEAEAEKEMSFREIRKTTCRRNFCTLKKEPVSTVITDPLPMPVTVPPLEEFKEFFDHLKTNTAVKGDYHKFKRGIHYNDGRIDLCKQVVGSEWIGDLMNSMVDNAYIEHFLLGNNIIDTVGSKKIADFIKNKNQPKIKTWYLAGNKIDAEGMALLADALKDDTVCEALWLKRNPLKVEGAKHVADLLASNKSITILDLHNTGLLDEGVKYVCEGLKKNRTVKLLYLDANGITKSGAEHLSEYFNYLTENKLEGITSLWIDMNRLDDDGVITLANSLKNYQPLERLVIGSNRMSSISGKCLLESLVNSPNLIFLDLGFYKSTNDMYELPNNLGDEGAEHISKFIENNKTVKVLGFMQNGITAEGIKKISESLTKNDSLLFIDFDQYGINIDQTVRGVINHKLRENIKNSLGLTMDEFVKTKLRFIRHTEKVKNIDSLYRNK